MPTCPPHYLCTFTPQQRYVVTRHLGLWWHGTGGLVVAIVAVVAIAVVLTTAVVFAYNAREAARIRGEREAERQHRLAIEEQHTLQADMAKGNPDLLRAIRANQ